MPLRKRATLRFAAPLLGVAVAGGFLFGPLGPGFERSRSWDLREPFAPVAGHAYRAQTPPHIAGSGLGRLYNSRLTLSEDSRPLGPADSDPQRVIQAGGGAFHHWGSELFFSASDGSDPNINGKSYVIAWPQSLPAWVYLGAAALGYVALLFAIHQFSWRFAARRPKLAAVFQSMASVFALAAFLETAAWATTKTDLSRAGQQAQRVFKAIFAGQEMESFGASVLYQEHHYLNYALANHALDHADQRAFEPVYHLRRREVIRPKKDVNWRVLVLGGSTTYGEGVAREDDTWIAQLEQAVRAQYGPDCDVINGGVGGYTVYENLIHYVTLLTHLEPDLVLLCVGLNDVHPRLYPEMAPDYAHYRQPWRSENQVLPPINRRLARLWMYRWWYARKHVANADLSNILRLVTRQPYPDAGQWPQRLAENTADLYRENLANFLRLIQAQGRRVALLPQYYDPRAPEDAVFAGAVREHNMIGQRLAEEFQAPWCASLLAPQSFGHADTWDQCHFYREGNAKMARYVAAFLDENQLTPHAAAAK